MPKKYNSDSEDDEFTYLAANTNLLDDDDYYDNKQELSQVVEIPEPEIFPPFEKIERIYADLQACRDNNMLLVFNRCNISNFIEFIYDTCYSKLAK